MALNIGKEVAALKRLSVAELRARYAEVTGEATRCRHKDHLVRRIVWHIQANAEGGLSERARRRARELAADSDVRLTAPRPNPADGPTKVSAIRISSDERLPMPGEVVTRKYKGRDINVRVLPNGFDYEGEHPAIVDGEVFRRVQAILRRNGVSGGKHVRNRFGTVLKGLLYCGPCGCAMVHTHTKKGQNKRYRYYVCLNAQKRGWHNCPSESIPAPEIERFVVDQVRSIGRDATLLAETLKEVRTAGQARIKELEAEQRGLKRDFKRHSAELRALAGRLATNGTASDRMADLQDRIRAAEQRAAQVRVVRLLVQRVVYDGEKSTVSVTFHPAGIKTLADELEEANA